MALVPCRECGKEVSEDAKVCQNCGVKFPSPKALATQTALTQNVTRWVKIGIVVLLIGGASAWIYHKVSSVFSPPISSDSTAAPAPRLQSTIPAKQQIIQKDYKEKVGEMLDHDKSVKEISDETGLSKKEIKKIKKEKKQKEKEAEEAAAAKKH
ncbi:MAG: hypothetical protein JWO03_1335 [Bacteroidetes bacterium]|nr:hypothetical protein [Bacteroidota bacterium]